MIPIAETVVRRLLDTALVWDNHACMPLRPGDTNFLPQIERNRLAGVNVVSINVGGGPLDLGTHVRALANFRRWFGERSDRYILARNIADIERARNQNKLAVLFDIEGLAPLDDGDHGLVQIFYDLGVRWMAIAYNRNNAAGGGCLDDDCGLSSHGRNLLAEMKRVGMVVCCSHTGHRTAMDVMEHAGNPVIFSHSNASAVHKHERNIPDELIKACAATGGVIGINGIGVFLGQNDDRPETMFRHIDHMVQLVGPAHVGLALDFIYDLEELIGYMKEKPEIIPPDPLLNGQPPKLVAPEAWPQIIELMLSNGYADHDIAGILGGNWLRIAQKVWR